MCLHRPTYIFSSQLTQKYEFSELHWSVMSFTIVPARRNINRIRGFMNHRIGFVRVKTFKPVFSKDCLNSPHVCVAVSKSCGMIGRNILGTKRATGDSLMSTASDFCTKGHQLGFQWMNMGEKGDDLLKVGRRNSSCEYLKWYLFHVSCLMCGTFI